LATSPFGRKAPPPSESWLEPRRAPFTRSKYRPKGERSSISLDYAINNNADYPARSSAVEAAAILEDPFDADWAALAMRNSCPSAQRQAFQEEKAWI
jgi:hypothetical protein